MIKEITPLGKVIFAKIFYRYIVLLFLISCGESPEQKVYREDSIKTMLIKHKRDSVVKDSLKAIRIQDATYQLLYDSLRNTVNSPLESLDSSVILDPDHFPKPSGRIVNIMIIGIDSRLGEKTARADANHLIRFFLDSGAIEIISVPRSTYADAKFTDPNGQLVGNVRLTLGRERYLKEIKRITEVSPIDYYVEFGFSQAIGIIELMGYSNNASNALRVIRSRKAFAAGDKQRSFDQGQFIKQAILRSFDFTNTLLGGIGLRAALALSTTNLSYEGAQYLINEVRSKGFSSTTKGRIWNRMMPNVQARLKVFNFDSANLKIIEEKIDKKVQYIVGTNNSKTPQKYVDSVLLVIHTAEVDTGTSPKKVIAALERPFQQKSWIQIKDKTIRYELRNRLCGMLIKAYTKIGRTQDAHDIVSYIELENKLRKMKREM